MDRLFLLQQRIKHRIEQAKSQIHPTHNRAFIYSVLIEIDTLNWVLNEISQYSINPEKLEKMQTNLYRKSGTRTIPICFGKGKEMMILSKLSLPVFNFKEPTTAEEWQKNIWKWGSSLECDEMTELIIGLQEDQ